MPRRLLFTALAFALATCVGEPATGPSSATSLRLPLQPAIIPGAADGTALPINRIRAVVRETSETQGGTVLAEARFDVDPQAESWDIDIDVPLTSSSAEVVVELSLIHASGGTEVVEFSGLTRPMTLEPGISVEPADVDIVRGPLSNLHVTDVTVGDVPGQLFEGASAPFTADVTSSEDEAPSTFWVSLEEEVAVVSDSIVTGVAPGVTRIVAAAGAHSDTTLLEVLPTPGDPAVFKTASTRRVAEGDTVEFTVVVVNGGGTDVANVVLEEHLPEGLTIESVETTLGVFDPDAATPMWTFEILPAGATDSLSLTMTVDAGTAGTTLTNEARLVLPQDFEDPEVENNVAFASVEVEQPVTGGDVTVTSGLPVGSGLQAVYSGNIGATNHGGTTVSIESLDPEALLVSVEDQVEGTATAAYDVPDGSDFFFFFLQGLEGVRDTVPVVVSADGFTPDTVEVSVVEPVVSLYGVNPAPDTLTGLNRVIAGVGVPIDTLDSPYPQSVRGGAGPLEVTLGSSAPGVLLPTATGGAGASVTAEIPAGLSTTSSSSLDEGGFALEPADMGSAEASVSIPGFRRVFASHLVEVGVPELAILYSPDVPASLQGQGTLYLGDSWAHGGSTITITSDGPEQLRFAADSLSPGTASLDLAVPDSVVSVPFWIQGEPFAPADQLSVTVSEPRFVGDTVDVSVVEPVAVLTELQDAYTATAPNQPFRAAAGYDAGSGLFLPMLVNPVTQGLTATIESSNEQVLSLVTNEFPNGTGSVVVPIPVGESHSSDALAEGGVELSVEGEGEATITVTIDGFGRIADLSSRTITVSP